MVGAEPRPGWFTPVGRRRVLQLLCCAVAGAVVSCGSGRRFPGDPGPGRLYYGATTPAYQDSLAWESWLGRTLASRRSYHQAGQAADLAAECAADLRARRMPHASIKPPGTWAQVAAGDYDTWLDQLLDRLATLAGPVLLTIHHEPENDASPTGMRAADFVAMQERAISRAATRARNVTITPVLMGWTFDPRSRRRPQDWVVPGAKVFGFDNYNPWSPTNGEQWLSFAERVDRIRPYANGKPMVVGEYGCREDPADPERAVRWMRQAYWYALRNNIVCMSYFNSKQNSPDGSWELYGRRADMFRHLLSRPEVARP